MHKKIFTIFAGLFLVASFNMAQETAEETGMSEPVAYINYIEGKALFKDFQNVELNMIVQEGDEINTIDGRIEILLKNGGVIRLDRNTRVIFSTLNDNLIMLEIWSGNVCVKKGAMEIGVKSASKSLNLSKDEWYFAGPEKSFKNWNNEREEELSYRSDTNNLPDGLDQYDYALSRYGAWRYYAPYGNIWVPQVGFGWRPYFHGRWIWYPIIGWTWISYEPFGWCVYHYGRWQWDLMFGWYWIPTRYWGPSWVYWHYLDNYWSWTPRWYDDHYYQRHQDRYTNISSNVWTTIHKDQLRSRDISKSVISKSELTKAGLYGQNQLRTSFPGSSVATTTNSLAPRKINPADRKIYSPDSRMSIQRKNPEPRTSTLNPSFQKRNDYSPRNTISPSRSYLSRTNTQFRSSLKNSIRSFTSSSRSFSRPQISRSPLSSRTIQGRKVIRKK